MLVFAVNRRMDDWVRIDDFDLSTIENADLDAADGRYAEVRSCQRQYEVLCVMSVLADAHMQFQETCPGTG